MRIDTTKEVVFPRTLISDSLDSVSDKVLGLFLMFDITIIKKTRDDVERSAIKNKFHDESSSELVTRVLFKGMARGASASIIICYRCQ